MRNSLLKFRTYKLIRAVGFWFVLLTLFSGTGNGQSFANKYHISDDISILTWNLQNFGKTKTDETLTFLDEIMNSYDIIAIQEVVGHSGGVSAVARLCNIMNQLDPDSLWRSSVSPMTTGSAYQTERYAFIWNSRRARLIGKMWLDTTFQSQIEREPYFATFAHTKDTFTVVNFHAIPKKKQPQREIKYFRYYPEIYPDLNLIFVGDFNTPQADNVFNPLKKMGYLPGQKNQKTTLKMKCVNGECLASEYDHIFYPADKIKKREAGIVQFYKKFPSMAAARRISDHVPVFFRFTIRK